jgi:hypothetical protein
VVEPRDLRIPIFPVKVQHGKILVGAHPVGTSLSGTEKLCERGRPPKTQQNGKNGCVLPQRKA